MTRRWLFADQLGPHFLDRPDQPVLLVESTEVFRRRRFHRQKAHLVLHALRTRARELGDQAVYVRATTYGEALYQLGEPVDVVQPTSYAADRLVRRRGIEVLPERGFVTTRADFADWAKGRRRLLLEDFYRWQRTRLGLLMDGDGPAGGRWNYDHDNREPPPRSGNLGVPEPWLAEEDDLDEEVRADLDRMAADGVEFVGDDGPRWAPSSRADALAALETFVRTRLASFGPTEDAMLSAEPWMAHSVLSPAINLGLLHPLECVEAAESAYRAGKAPLASVEGYLRQVIGWREYVYSIYWHVGPGYRRSNALQARTPIPSWFDELDAEAVDANCLSHVLHDLRERGWVHHIPRLMVLGNWALQRGYEPAALTAWFHEKFADGYDWVMVPNVVGMSQHADGGLMATKPYAAGGAYINRMSDYCGGCRYDPRQRLGDDACPFTAGYWAFLDRTQHLLDGNPRMRQPLASLQRLADREAVVDQERRRGDAPP